MSTSQGVIFLKKKDVNGESKWFEDGDEENDGKYVGKIENGKPNGHGTLTSPDGDKYEGEYEDWDTHVTCRLGKFTDRHDLAEMSYYGP